MLAKADARQNSSTVTYTALGLLDKDQNPAGGFLDLSRSDTANGYIVSATTAEGRTSSFEVETLLDGSTKRSNTDPTGLATVTTEGADQSVVTQTPDGTVTTVSASPDPRFGALAPLQGLTVTTPGGLVSSIDPDRTVTFDTGGVLATQTDTLNINGRVFTSVFDRAQLKFTDTSPEGRTTTSFIDAQGRIVQQEIGGFHPIDFGFDSRKRLTSVTQGTGAEQRIRTITYNAQGFVDTITDPENRVFKFEYDSTGRLVKQILPDLSEIQYTHDDNGNIASVIPPGRPAHTHSYNSVDLMTEYNPPSVAGSGINKTLYNFSLDKQLLNVTRPDGRTINFSYGSGGRLDSFDIQTGTETKTYLFSYYLTEPGKKGRLQTITHPDGGTLTFDYDGALLTESTWGGSAGSIAGTVSRTYDNDFRVVSQTVNGGNAISFSYDNDNLLTSAGAESLAYDAQSGLLTDVTLGNVSDSYAYNGFGEATGYDSLVNGTSALNQQFVRDHLGRITQKTEILFGVTHVYDYAYEVSGRLKEVKKDGVVIASYTYDANGNRLNDGAVYDAQDRLLSNNTATFAYNEDGQLLSRDEAGQVTQYTYDALDNLTKVVLPDGTVIEYIVDGLNRRVGRKVNGTLERAWLYDDLLNPIAELDQNQNVVSRFVYGAQVNTPDYMIKGGVTYKIISDNLGSPRLVVNTSDGTVVQQLEYDEWGNVLVDTNPGFQPFGFAGGIYDSDTKLIRFGARDYSSEIGRWTMKDPILFTDGRTNLYAYALNDPVNFIDITGKSEQPKKSVKLTKRTFKKIPSELIRALTKLRRVPKGHFVVQICLELAFLLAESMYEQSQEITLSDDEITAIENTLTLIENGGPFPHLEEDGKKWENNKNQLPPGDYKEYTVETPGLTHRGKRRIVTGIEHATGLRRVYYTRDHYESFVEISEGIRFE